MALSTKRVCGSQRRYELCPPRRIVCPGGCKPGFCLNANCIYNSQPWIMYGMPEDQREADERRQIMEDDIKRQREMERKAFLESEKKQMGMIDFDDGGNEKVLGSHHEEDGARKTSCLPMSQTDFGSIKTTTVRRNMRPPARPSCMLHVPDILDPVDDYSELSYYLRASTMPCYSRHDTITAYKDTHNMAVWNNRKDMDRHIYKLKRDWLSIWGELNVKDQRCKKAWQERLAGDAGKK